MAAVEFSLLAVPFFIIVFATLESFAAYAGEQLLGNAVDTLGRRLRTGQITYNLGRTTDMNATQFRAAFCAEVSIMLSCPPPNDPNGEKLYLDVREFTTFSNMPKGIPRQGNKPYGDLDTTGFDYDPGGPSTKNMVRAYYRWEILTDLVRPYITNVRPEGQAMPTDYLMVATTAFQNEPYP